MSPPAQALMSDVKTPTPLDEAALVLLPKVELHCHVDGAARPQTLLELARQARIPLPADTVEELLPHVRVSPHGTSGTADPSGPGTRSLRDFLATFETFYPVLRSPGAMGRLAHELAIDMAADGVVHLEARFCPALQAADAGSVGAGGVEDVLRETLAGLAAGARRTGLSVGAIVCCYRPLPVEVNARLVQLALAYADRGVTGLDLAGPEDVSAAPLHALFRRAADARLPITVHAGEAAGPDSVWEALDHLHATRIGHGVAAARDERLVERLADRGTTLECCLTSNLATGAVASLSEHPFESLRRAGVRVTLSTDDPSVCGTTASRERLLAVHSFGLTPRDLLGIESDAVTAAFVGPTRRAELRGLIAGSSLRPVARRARGL